jgi:hypothetical protein
MLSFVVVRPWDRCLMPPFDTAAARACDLPPRRHARLRLTRRQKAQKRVFDFALSVVLLFFSAPLMGVLMLLLRWRGIGAVFSRENALGEGHKPISVLRSDAACYQSQPGSSLRRILRRIGLDGLHLLISVVRGDTSILGPALAAQRPDLHPGPETPSLRAWMRNGAPVSSAKRSSRHCCARCGARERKVQMCPALTALVALVLTSAPVLAVDLDEFPDLQSAHNKISAARVLLEGARGVQSEGLPVPRQALSEPIGREDGYEEHRAKAAQLLTAALREINQAAIEAKYRPPPPALTPPAQPRKNFFPYDHTKP